MTSFRHMPVRLSRFATCTSSPKCARAFVVMHACTHIANLTLPNWCYAGVHITTSASTRITTSVRNTTSARMSPSHGELAKGELAHMAN